MYRTTIPTTHAWNRITATVGAKEVVVALGSLFLALGLGWGPLEVSRGTPVGTALMLSGFIVGPGLLLLHGAYRVPRSDVGPAFRPTISYRCLGGLGVMLGIVAIYHLQSAGGIDQPLRAGVILGAFGSVAGFRVGVHDARATELQRTKERLDATVDRLQTSNELLDQFAYAASHDLQEPLRMVSSHLLLLERKYGDDLDEEGREYLDFAVDRADRMRAMIDGLLEYSRIETADEPREPVALDAVVDDVLADLDLQIEETDADIDVEALPRVEGDASQLHQVFQNLLSNAIKYSGDGQPRVQVAAERTGSTWTVSVRDEGIGIRSDETDRIFQVFERLEPRGSVTGTGMGLTLCRRIVERHGGEIWVESTHGEGSTFYFTLPAVEVPADE